MPQKMVDDLVSDPSRARGTTGQEYVDSLLKNRDKYNLSNYSDVLASKELLLIGGWQDYTKKIEDELLPLYRQIISNGAQKVKVKAFETDHSFSDVEEDLAQCIVSWLKD